MSNADLSIKVTADLTPATVQVDKLSDKLVALGKDAETAAVGMDKINPVTSKVQQNLAQTAMAAAKADSSLAKMGKGSSQAAFALTNLGRVAQDAPFGFIGIQNNLNPLLESFQRLKAETGSTSGALKALGSSLLGAGGIGFALSAASAAILLFQSGLISFGGETKKAKAAAKEFAESLKEAEASALSSGVQLQTYAAIASDTNKSLSERNYALDKANKLMGEHGEKLTLVNIATKGATDEINKYTEATIQQALANKFSNKVADLIIAQRDAIKSYTAALSEYNKEQARASKETVISGGTGGVAGLSNIGRLNALKSKYDEAVSVYKSITTDLVDIHGQLFNAEGMAAQLFGELGKKLPDAKAAKIAKDIKEKIEKSFELEKMILRPELIEISSEKIKAAAEKAQKDINDALGKKPMKTKVQLEVDIDFSNAGNELDKPFTPTTTQFAWPKKNADDYFAKLKEFAQQVEQVNQSMADSLKDTMNDAFVSIGEGIAQSLGSGADFGKTVFGSLFKILGAGIEQLGKAMIALGTAKMVIEKFKFSPGIGTLLAGIATVAIGALLKNALPGFADGVTNFGGGIAMVGERGPELVRLPKGSDVIPNGRVNGMLAGGGAQVFIPAITLRGQDLVVAFNRANQTIGRNG